MQRAVSIEEAKASAMEALRGASPDSIRHLLDTCRKGGLIGKRYDSCFYGTLTKGTGFCFEDLPDHEVFQTVQAFCSSVGVDLRPNGPHTPIERFCFNIYARQTSENCEELALIAVWCNEALMTIQSAEHHLNVLNLPRYEQIAELVPA